MPGCVSEKSFLFTSFFLSVLGLVGAFIFHVCLPTLVSYSTNCLHVSSTGVAPTAQSWRRNTLSDSSSWTSRDRVTYLVLELRRPGCTTRDPTPGNGTQRPSLFRCTAPASLLRRCQHSQELVAHHRRCVLSWSLRCARGVRSLAFHLAKQTHSCFIPRMDACLIQHLAPPGGITDSEFRSALLYLFDRDHSPI